MDETEKLFAYNRVKVPTLSFAEHPVCSTTDTETRTTSFFRRTQTEMKRAELRLHNVDRRMTFTWGFRTVLIFSLLVLCQRMCCQKKKSQSLLTSARGSLPPKSSSSSSSSSSWSHGHEAWDSSRQARRLFMKTKKNKKNTTHGRLEIYTQTNTYMQSGSFNVPLYSYASSFLNLSALSQF